MALRVIGNISFIGFLALRDGYSNTPGKLNYLYRFKWYNKNCLAATKNDNVVGNLMMDGPDQRFSRVIHRRMKRWFHDYKDTAVMQHYETE